MDSVRLVEHYTSIQCEGPRTGTPTQFVQFAGCNMRCPGWPCDTQHAIQPSIFMQPRGSEKMDHYAVVCKALEQRDMTGASNVCLTGGEPFLQDDEQLRRLCFALFNHDFTVEVFTNGSFPFPQWAIAELDFVMDWKLPGSGEQDTQLETRTKNALHLLYDDVVKFVVCDTNDLERAVMVWENLKTLNCEAEFWVGVAFGRMEPSFLVEWILERALPWKLNVQVHKYIWHPDERLV